MKKTLIFVLTLLVMACTDKEAGENGVGKAPGQPIAVASNYPLYFFASEIAGDAVDVRFPSIEGDPAMWTPSGKDVAMLQSADLLILNGAGYEAWLAFATVPHERILDTTANASDMLLPIAEGKVHQHGPQGKHSHQRTAITTWLDPALAIEQARAVKVKLTEFFPDQANSFQVNFERLEQRLLGLDQSLARVFSALSDRPVFFSHPVYQYLQQRYSINGLSLHWEPDVEPGTRDWIDLSNLLRQHPAKLMLWEGPWLDATQDRLARMEIESVLFNPVANRPGNGDYFIIMEQNLLRLEEIAKRVTGND